MKCKVKLCHEDAVAPRYATDGSACFDFVAVSRIVNGQTAIYDTGLSFEPPKGYAIKIYPRSGLAFNSNIRISNCVPVIDGDFRGTVKIKLIRDDGNEPFPIVGDRIAQGELCKVINVEFEEVEELTETKRGNGGFGSTGE